MNFDEIIVKEELSEYLTYTGLKLEDSCISWHSQINDSIVQTNILSYNWHLWVTFAFFLTPNRVFETLVQYLTTSICYLERKNCC